jgi:hypothetical protein
MSQKKKELPATKAGTPAAQETRKPVQAFRVEDVSCSIWAREVQVQGKPRTFHSCTFERSYKDRDGSYRYTKTFDPDSLGKLVTLCHQASEWITEAQAMADQNTAAEQEAD